MKLTSFRNSNRQSYGVVEGEIVKDVGSRLADKYPDLKSAISGSAFKQLLDAARSAPALDLASLEFLPVIPNPTKIFCIGHNYEEHRLETGRPKTGSPSVFIRFADSQVAHGQPVILPSSSTEFDFEGELAVIIGRGGRYIKKADALAHVAGYSCYNDVSVRDWQRHTSQFTPGKNFPSTGAFGPWMVTADEIPNPQELTLTTRLNGVQVQHASTSQMIFQVSELIEYCSSFTNLYPGDVIVSGTPGGVGMKRTPPLFMKAGDVVEVDIESVGLLRNLLQPE